MVDNTGSGLGIVLGVFGLTALGQYLDRKKCPKYRINFKLLKEVKKKGFCLCDSKKKEDGSNICPCDDFLKTGKCKCGIFK